MNIGIFNIIFAAAAVCPETTKERSHRKSMCSVFCKNSALNFSWLERVGAFSASVVSEALTELEKFFFITSPWAHFLQCDNMKSIGEAVSVSSVLHWEHFAECDLMCSEGSVALSDCVYLLKVKFCVFAVLSPTRFPGHVCGSLVLAGDICNRLWNRLGRPWITCVCVCSVCNWDIVEVNPEANIHSLPSLCSLPRSSLCVSPTGD